MTDLPAPGTQFLARIDVEAGEVRDLGATDAGHRRVIVLDGGTVSGEHLRGTVLPGGTDRQVRLADGTTTVDTDYTIRTHDDALVHVRATGVQTGPPGVLDALARSEDVDPSSCYFRTAMTFETSAESYRWLTRVLTVCSVARRGSTVLVDAWTIT